LSGDDVEVAELLDEEVMSMKKIRSDVDREYSMFSKRRVLSSQRGARERHRFQLELTKD
jgi:hypothetical protein